MALDLSKYKTSTPPPSGGIDLSKYKIAPAPQKGFYGKLSDTLGNVSEGFAKGELSTAKGLGTIGQTVLDQTAGRVVNAARGKGFTPTGPDNTASDLYRRGTPLAQQADQTLAPRGAAQNVGKAAEKVAEFATPTGIEAGAAKLGAKLLPGIAKSTSIGAKLLKFLGKGAAAGVDQGGKAALSGEDKAGVATNAALGAASPLVPLATGAVKGTFKALKSTINPEVEQALTRAIKPGTNNTRWDADLNLALPHIAQTAEQAGKPIKTIEDLAGNVTATKKRVWAAYAEQLGPNVHETIDGSPIADAMIASMNNRFVSQNPAAAKKLVQMAETYRREIPLGEAEDFLQSANNDLHSYYAKNKVGQAVAKADPSVGHVVAEADALRTELYKKLDSLTGSSAGELKRVYGALTNIQEASIKRANVAARQNTDSLAEQLGFAQGMGRIAKSAANFELGDAAAGVAQMAGAKLLKDKNTTNGLIEHAFAKYGRKPVLPKAK